MARRVELFRCLQGIISIFKPPNQDISKFQRRVANKITNELNALPWETERIRTTVLPKGDIVSLPSVSTEIDIVDNPLVIGRRFVPSDIILNLVDPLPEFASGIQLMGIGEIGAYDHVDTLYKQRFPKSYHISGMFGQASSTGLATGSVMYRSPWRHITRPKLDRVLASLEFKARTASLLQAGLVPNTQKAYEALSDPSRTTMPLKPLAEPCESLPPDHVTAYWDRRPEPTQPHSLRARPDLSSVSQLPPSLQAIRCIAFEPPFFTLEIQVLYETDEFLTDLIGNIGASLRSSCVLSTARRIRHGPLTVRDTLLLKECVIPRSLYETFVNLHSQRSETDFDDEDSCRKYILSRLVNSGTNLFSNLVNCTLDKLGEVISSKKE